MVTAHSPLAPSHLRHSKQDGLTDLIFARPTSHTPKARSHRLPSPHPPSPIARPPPPKQLTSLQLPRQWVVVRWYQGTDVPSYPEPRWEGSATRLHPALLRSSMGRSSQHARGSRKMACPVQPRPEACLPPYLSRYSAMSMAMAGNPYHAHTMPNTCQR